MLFQHPFEKHKRQESVTSRQRVPLTHPKTIPLWTSRAFHVSLALFSHVLRFVLAAPPAWSGAHLKEEEAVGGDVVRQPRVLQQAHYALLHAERVQQHLREVHQRGRRGPEVGLRWPG